MTCDQVDELLSDYIDDDLSAGIQAAVQEHLASCDACAASLKKLRRTVRFVRSNAPTIPAARRAGRNYDDFVRSIMDEEAPRSTGEVLLEWLAGDARAEGDRR
jgi:anti-sigma factor RsiW